MGDLGRGGGGGGVVESDCLTDDKRKCNDFTSLLYYLLHGPQPRLPTRLSSKWAGLRHKTQGLKMSPFQPLCSNLLYQYYAITTMLQEGHHAWHA